MKLLQKFCLRTKTCYSPAAAAARTSSVGRGGPCVAAGSLHFARVSPSFSQLATSLNIPLSSVRGRRWIHHGAPEISLAGMEPPPKWTACKSERLSLEADTLPAERAASAQWNHVGGSSESGHIPRERSTPHIQDAAMWYRTGSRTRGDGAAHELLPVWFSTQLRHPSHPGSQSHQRHPTIFLNHRCPTSSAFPYPVFCRSRVIVTTEALLSRTCSSSPTWRRFLQTFETTLYPGVCCDELLLCRDPFTLSCWPKPLRIQRHNPANGPKKQTPAGVGDQGSQTSRVWWTKWVLVPRSLQNHARRNSDRGGGNTFRRWEMEVDINRKNTGKLATAEGVAKMLRQVTRPAPWRGELPCLGPLRRMQR